MRLLSGPEYKIFKILIILTGAGERSFLMTYEDIRDMLYISQNTVIKSMARLTALNMIITDDLGKYGTEYRITLQDAWAIKKPKAEPLTDPAL
jgi:hypothetical protein